VFLNLELFNPPFQFIKEGMKIVLYNILWDWLRKIFYRNKYYEVVIMKEEDEEIFYEFKQPPTISTKILLVICFSIAIIGIISLYPNLILFLIFEPLYIIAILLFLILLAILAKMDKNK